MSFQNRICILKVLANSETGETAGKIAKRVGGYKCNMSRRQVEHALKELQEDGYVSSEVVAYRGDLVQRKYHMTLMAAGVFESLSQDFGKMLTQGTI